MLVNIVNVEAIIEDVIEERRAGDEYTEKCYLRGDARWEQQLRLAARRKCVEHHAGKRRCEGYSECNVAEHGRES